VSGCGVRVSASVRSTSATMSRKRSSSVSLR
jgi:hypothetical protein